MSDSPEEPWSDNPNAPQIPPWLYIREKSIFAGFIVGGILYGIVVILFFQCIGALINPANDTRRSVKLGLAAYAVALFLIPTIPLVAGRDVFPTVFIDIRNFPGTEEYPPGPLGGAMISNASDPWVALLGIPAPVSQWLSNGFLLYRCYAIYSMNYWTIALPSLMYVASIGTGIANIYFTPTNAPLIGAAYIIVSSYYVICLVLNILLTLMIIAKLILHRRNLRHAIGTSNGATGVYTTIVTILLESYTLYAIALLSYIITWAMQSAGVYVTARILGNVQVIAPYLIILRVAKRKALTSEMISGSDNVSSIQFRSQGSTDGDGSLLDGDPTSSIQANGEAPEEAGAGAENVIEEVPL